MANISAETTGDYGGAAGAAIGCAAPRSVGMLTLTAVMKLVEHGRTEEFADLLTRLTDPLPV